MTDHVYVKAELILNNCDAELVKDIFGKEVDTKAFDSKKELGHVLKHASEYLPFGSNESLHLDTCEHANLLGTSRHQHI